MPTRILLADDHTLLRQGLRLLLEKESDFQVVGEADTGRKCVELAARLQPNVVIMDLSMPDLNGIDATRKVLAATPSSKVVALSMHSDRRFVIGALRAGASGYVLKESAFDELADAIRAVISNRKFVSSGVAGLVIDEYLQHATNTDTVNDRALTPREREVLQLIAEGQNTKQIARRLHVSSKTIDTHRLQLMRKLGVHSVAELTKFAVREGLTSLER